MNTKVLITGATGMLGRSILRELSTTPNITCIGTGFSRARSCSPPLVKLDLLDENAVQEVMETYKPDVVIHCAAERKPDKVEQDKERSIQLNVNSTKFLACQCEKFKSFMIYISTDYVFDGGIYSGVLPPYKTDATTRPVNDYGVTKRDGETEVMKHCCGTNTRSLILRVPVLYALDCKYLDESASLVVAKALRSKSPLKIDNWGMRFPTLVDDVARCIKLLLEVGLELEVEQSKEKDRSGNNNNGTKIIHFSSPTQCTKFELVKLMGDILGMSHSHISPDSEAPKGAVRPQNTQLDCSATWKYLGIDKFPFTPLHDGIRQALEPFKNEGFQYV